MQEHKLEVNPHHRDNELSMADSDKKIILTLKEASELLTTIQEAQQEYTELVDSIHTQTCHIYSRINKQNRHLIDLDDEQPDDFFDIRATDAGTKFDDQFLHSELHSSKDKYALPTGRTQSLQHELVEAVVKALAWSKQPQAVQHALDHDHDRIDLLFKHRIQLECEDHIFWMIGSGIKSYLSRLFRSPPVPVDTSDSEPTIVDTDPEKTPPVEPTTLESQAREKLRAGDLFSHAVHHWLYSLAIEFYLTHLVIAVAEDPETINAIERVRATIAAGKGAGELLEDTNVYEMRALLGELTALYERIVDGSGGNTCFMETLPDGNRLFYWCNEDE